jgi:hypothetical protein
VASWGEACAAEVSADGTGARVTCRRIVLVCAALAVAVVPACSRTGLDDPGGLGPGNLGLPSDDDASAGDDSPGSSSSGGDRSSGGGSSASGGSAVATSGVDAGDLFSHDETGTGATGPTQATDAQAPGKPACGPGNCGGCCAENGTCESGQATSSCGHDGQPCMECEAERSCNDRGTCL